MRITVIIAVIIIALWNSLARSGYDPLGLNLPTGTAIPPRTPSSEPSGVTPASRAESAAESAPTPPAEIERVLLLLPTPQDNLIEIGCGAYAPWCFAAAKKGWRSIGVEIDPVSASVATRRVRDAGLSHLITIVEGDATKINVAGDVVVMYLWPETIANLVPKLKNMRAVASYQHEPIGLNAIRNGDTWIYTKPVPVAPQHRVAYWNGVSCERAVCNSPNCAMCASILAQIAQTHKLPAGVAVRSVDKPAQPSGQWVRFKICNGRACWFENRWVPNQ